MCVGVWRPALPANAAGGGGSVVMPTLPETLLTQRRTITTAVVEALDAAALCLRRISCSAIHKPISSRFECLNGSRGKVSENAELDVEEQFKSAFIGNLEEKQP